MNEAKLTDAGLRICTLSYVGLSGFSFFLIFGEDKRQ